MKTEENRTNTQLSTTSIIPNHQPPTGTLPPVISQPSPDSSPSVSYGGPFKTHRFPATVIPLAWSRDHEITQLFRRSSNTPPSEPNHFRCFIPEIRWHICHDLIKKNPITHLTLTVEACANLPPWDGRGWGGKEGGGICAGGREEGVKERDVLRGYAKVRFGYGNGGALGVDITCCKGGRL